MARFFLCISLILSISIAGLQHSQELLFIPFYNATKAFNTNNQPAHTEVIGNEIKTLRMVDNNSIKTESIDSISSTPKQWTIIMYMAADGDMNQAGIDDLNELEKVGTDENINIIALLDLRGNNNTNIYEVKTETPSSSNIISFPLSGTNLPPEINTGDQNNLTNYVKWAVQNYPAEHYLLNIWGHGLGWRGVGYDEYNGNDSLNPNEIETALKSVKETTGRPLDILAFDACMMQMSEVANAAGRDSLAEIMIGSEETAPGPGWDYGIALSSLNTNPDQEPRELAINIVNHYVNLYAGDKATYSAISLKYVPEISKSLADLCDMIRSNNAFDEVVVARSKTAHFSDSNNIDLYDLAVNIQTTSTNDSIKNQAKLLSDSIEQSLIIERHTPNYPRAHGLSIFFPITGKIENSYYFMNFTNNHWSDFLAAYIKYAQD